MHSWVDDDIGTGEEMALIRISVDILIEFEMSVRYRDMNRHLYI